MPKIQLSFADITILSGNVVHEVDKQFNNAGVPIGNIRFQGKLHTSCIILSKSFSQKKKKKTEVTYILISSTGLPMSQFNFSFKLKTGNVIFLPFHPGTHLALQYCCGNSGE